VFTNAPPSPYSIITEIGILLPANAPFGANRNRRPGRRDSLANERRC